MHIVEKKIRLALNSLALDSYEHMLIALSGGSDSVALTLALANIYNKQISHLSAMHIDHGIRSANEIEQDLVFLESFCNKLKIKLELVHIPQGEIVAYAEKNSESIESAARIFRYKALSTHAEKINYKCILTAHNANDQLETMVMRLCLGSGLRGLKGIPQKNKKIYRPMLTVTKDEILDYLQLHNQQFSVDSTNSTDLYMRNKVRHNILPVIESIFPKVLETMQISAERLALANDFLQKEAEKIVWNYSENLDFYAISASNLFSFHNALIIESVFSIYNKLNSNERLSYSFLTACLAVLKTKNESFIFSQIVFLRYKDFIYMYKKREAIQYSAYFTNCATVFCGKNIKITIKSHEALSADLMATCVEFPLIIRSPCVTDTLSMKTGSKKVFDVFSNLGIPDDFRYMIPIVEDKKGIVCILLKVFEMKNRYAERGFIPTQNDRSSKSYSIEVNLIGDKND